VKNSNPCDRASPRSVGGGLRQYRESLAKAGPFLCDLEEETTSTLSKLWSFLTTRVVPGKGQHREEAQSRHALRLRRPALRRNFRRIFLVLFVSLNYQSFWEIGQARVASLIAPPSIGTPANSLQDTLQQQLKLIPSLAKAGGMEGNLVSFLPDVGPPDNRLIIPNSTSTCRS